MRAALRDDRERPSREIQPILARVEMQASLCDPERKGRRSHPDYRTPEAYSVQLRIGQSDGSNVDR